jgi:flavin reductase (DIM6/NTAB) family NADH-FMN oxidoreductase RutF/DNA-binding IclR family transcriptional regulator
MMTPEKAVEASSGASGRYFREVLGHFPTGVAVATACEPDGTPQGMVVGSFTSVSLDPPLVAFLPAKKSSTFPHIREIGRFCVNVLAADQEAVCRSFAVGTGANRFAGVPWHASPGGSPILDDVVAWIDCDIDTIHEAGDHYVVIGAVRDLQIVRPTVPLLFFQGGYGSFAHGSLVIGAREEMREQVRLADLARLDMEKLTEDTGLSSRVVACLGRQSVIVAVASGKWGSTKPPLGVAVPHIPPLGGIFRAWSECEGIEAWIDSSPKSLEEPRRAQIRHDLEVIRRNGWVLSLRDTIAADVADTLDAMVEYGQTPGLERAFSQIASRMVSHADPADLDEPLAGRVASMSAPVFGPDGDVVLSLSLVDIPGGSTLDFVLAARDRLRSAARAITERLGGTPPACFPGYEAVGAVSA